MYRVLVVCLVIGLIVLVAGCHGGSDSPESVQMTGSMFALADGHAPTVIGAGAAMLTLAGQVLGIK